MVWKFPRWVVDSIPWTREGWVDQNAKSRGMSSRPYVSIFFSREIREMYHQIQFIKFVLGEARTRYAAPVSKVRIN